tara:strand:- start:10276 stop:10806 length:531 start_codon:yes stop_codon:yes gene_type:complete
MTKLKLKSTERVFKMFADKVINQSIRNLKNQDHIDSGKLAQGLSYDLKVHKSLSLELNFKMPMYGMFQDKGVKGSQSGRRAYKSPYKFKGKNIKEDVIEAWIKRKGIQGRDKKGRFIKRESLAYLIGRKIALFGLPATRFFSNAFRQHYRKLPKNVIQAYAQDVSKFLKETTQDIK